MPTTDTIRVVHLDDDAELLELTTEFVERHYPDIAIETVTSPQACLERLGEGGVDCVITDYKMADMDGLELLRTIREESPDLPVIFFTGKGSEEIASEAISLGVTDYLQKGTGTEQFHILGNRIEGLVGRSRAERRAAAADKRVRELYERVTVAFVALDDDYRFSYLNGEAESLFDQSEPDLVGTSLWDAFPELVDTEVESRLRRAMDEGETVHARGELTDPDRILEIHAYPAEDGISAFIDDVTEQVEREAELESLRTELELTEQQFRTLKQKLAKPPSPFR